MTFFVYMYTQYIRIRTVSCEHMTCDFLNWAGKTLPNVLRTFVMSSYAGVVFTSQ